MDIGRPKRIIEIEPVSVPVPEPLELPLPVPDPTELPVPIPEPSEVPVAVPEPSETPLTPDHEPSSLPREQTR